MKTVTVHASLTYEVQIENGLLDRCGQQIRQVLPRGRAAIITDDTVASLYLEQVQRSLDAAGVEHCTFTFPHGEDSKSHPVLLSIYDFLIEHAITRSDFLIALGGGVVGDITGFAAATYLRGIPFVQLPTTFLAAVDSSVGGKTAVNIPAGKNLIGAFHQPSLVVCDPLTFSTLPPEVFADGAAEMVKYGFIYDAAFLRFLLEEDIRPHLEQVVATCVDIKRQVVEADEHDLGQRMILNFGHTLGHAIEKQSNHTVTHGHAISMGMVLVQQLGQALGVCPPEMTDLVRQGLARYGLPTSYPGDPKSLIALCLNDKKRAGGTLNLILVPEAGRAVIQPVPVEQLDALAKEAFPC